VSAPWLEQLVWSDGKRFITNPGEVPRAVREQLSEARAAPQTSLSSALPPQGLRAGALRPPLLEGVLYEGDEDALEHLLDLKNQAANLRLMLEAARAEQADSAAQRVIADTTEAYLMALRERADEIEEDTPEAILERQRLVRLPVERITLHKSEIGKTTVAVTYRFGPPKSAEPALPEDSMANSNRRTSLWVLNRTRGPKRRRRCSGGPCPHRRPARGSSVGRSRG
jgi:hypothetical protein